MTTYKTLVSASALLAVAGVALAADPGMKLLSGGAKAGGTAAVVVKGIVGTAGSLQGAGVQIQFDPAKVTPTAVVPGADWVAQGGFNIDGGNVVKIALLPMANGQTADATLCTISFTVNGNSKLTLLPTSAVTDDQYMDWNPSGQAASVINGAVAQVGPMAGAPSVGFDKKVAVAAGGKLQLLNSADLTAVAGFTAPAVGASSGRPAFGVIGTDPVVAVGDDTGTLTVAKVADGTVVFTKALGAKVSTPAIDADGTVYAAVTNTTGTATLWKVVAGAETQVASLAGNTVLGAPAVYNGGIAIGTEKGVESFNAAGVPQAGISDAAGATVAPIIGNGGLALSANDTNLLGFNVVTGAPVGAAGAHNAGKLSEAWLDGNNVIFGTASGKILSVDLTSGTPTLGATALSTAAIGAEPIVIGTTTWAIDANGYVVNTAGDSLPLNGVAAKAVAATGRTAGTDSIVTATADGTLAAIAF